MSSAEKSPDDRIAELEAKVERLERLLVPATHEGLSALLRFEGGQPGAGDVTALEWHALETRKAALQIELDAIGLAREEARRKKREERDRARAKELERDHAKRKAERAQLRLTPADERSERDLGGLADMLDDLDKLRAIERAWSSEVLVVAFGQAHQTTLASIVEREGVRARNGSPPSDMFRFVEPKRIESLISKGYTTAIASLRKGDFFDSFRYQLGDDAKRIEAELKALAPHGSHPIVVIGESSRVVHVFRGPKQ